MLPKTVYKKCVCETSVAYLLLTMDVIPVDCELWVYAASVAAADGVVMASSYLELETSFLLCTFLLWPQTWS